MNIAIVQMRVVQGDPDANIAKIRSYTRKAKERGADVVVFPEYSATGSVRNRPDLIDAKGAYRKVFAALARESGIDLIPGSFIEMDGRKAYNTSCYFDRSGRLLAAYRKVNLWHSERGRLSRGRGSVVFGTRFGRCGIAICWDLTSPELFRRMAKKGARLVYVPSFWSDAGISNYPYEARNIDTLCHARAFENGCAIAYSNAAGVYEPGDNLIGHSQLTLPIGGAVKKLDHSRESLMIAELPKKALERAAKVYKIRSDIVSGYLK
jgi:predicted amidohydrolase